jgi:serine phosphatase RsbU (regulator of sigma subunit)
VLGCDGGAVAVLDPDDEATLLSYVTSSYGPDAQAGYGRLPVTARLPVAVAATTGERVLVRDRDEAVAFSPEMGEVVEVTGSQAFASVPLRIGGRVVGVLTAGWDAPQEFGEGQLALLETFASQCAQALHRLQALEAERAAARRVARIAEGLQRSLLAELPGSPDLELAARYVPAADEAQVGGDWYDAFRVGDDTLYLVIGDVAGHDHQAAVQMAQVRNVLRGVAHAVVGPPAAVLEALDRALRDLVVDAVATAVLATVTEGTGGGPRTLRWSSAGHPPPLLLHADGRVEHLDSTPDLLLGVRAETSRHDHEHVLPPGSTLVLYTDGLVERRDEHLGAGLARLRRNAAELGGRPLEELCSTLLARQSHGHEDDVALIALRARD